MSVPDDLERLWTPHRMAYISGAEQPAEGYDKPSGCPFCRHRMPTDEPRRRRAASTSSPCSTCTRTTRAT